MHEVIICCMYIFSLFSICGCTFERNDAEKTLSHNDSILVESNKINLEAVQYIVLPFDKNTLWAFPKDSKNAEVTSEEIRRCEAILLRHIKAYNQGRKPAHQVDLNNYGRQYIAALTPQNNKVVYINAFCDPEEFDYWKRTLVTVEDGGNCFFQLVIDLQTNEVTEFYVNGVA